MGIQGRLDLQHDKQSMNHLLEPLLQVLNLILLSLLECLALAAGGESSDVGLGGVHSSQGESCGQSCGCQQRAHLQSPGSQWCLMCTTGM